MSSEPSPLPLLELLELATGYQRSKTLFALVEMGVPTLLAGQSLPLKEIVRTLGLHPIAADRFLNSSVALGLLEQVDGDFRNTALSERFLVKGKPTYLGDQLLKYDRASYPLWGDLTSRLKTWQPGESGASQRPVTEGDPEEMRAQHNLSLMVGHALGSAFDFSKHRVMLDLGGGTGAMSIGVCDVYPDLHSIVVDLPGTADVAKQCVNESGLSERIEVRSGNFKEDELPLGFDIAILANLLSVASEETNRHLFKRLFEALPEGGVCILSGWILDDSRSSPLIPVLFCLEDIGWDAPDVERTASAYKRWLEEAGFTDIERTMYCPPTSMIVARKPRAKLTEM
jgi:3-hydroxy-5-methyl-1-naphthoate 3-O-methyltransferase